MIYFLNYLHRENDSRLYHYCFYRDEQLFFLDINFKLTGQPKNPYLNIAISSLR